MELHWILKFKRLKPKWSLLGVASASCDLGYLFLSCSLPIWYSFIPANFFGLHACSFSVDWWMDWLTDETRTFLLNRVFAIPYSRVCATFSEYWRICLWVIVKKRQTDKQTLLKLCPTAIILRSGITIMIINKKICRSKFGFQTWFFCIFPLITPKLFDLESPFFFFLKKNVLCCF